MASVCWLGGELIKNSLVLKNSILYFDMKPSNGLFSISAQLDSIFFSFLFDVLHFTGALESSTALHVEV